VYQMKTEHAHNKFQETSVLSSIDQNQELATMSPNKDNKNIIENRKLEYEKETIKI